MGIFDGIFGAQRQAAPSLTAVFVAPPVGDQAEQIRAAKELAKESDGILAVLSSTGETCLAVACATSMEPVVVVVTDRRTFTTKRGRIRREIRHHDVADVSVGNFTNEGVLVTIEPKSPGGSLRPEQGMQLLVASPKIGDVIRSHIWRQEQGADQHSLPRDIIPLMERFGHMEFDPQGQGAETGHIWLRLAHLVMPFAQADPAGFLSALANAVLPVGGWAVYGASRAVWEFLSPDHGSPLRRDPSYKAIMSAALDFLRSNGVPPMNVRGYEWEYWLDAGGTRDTWLPQ